MCAPMLRQLDRAKAARAVEPVLYTARDVAAMTPVESKANLVEGSHYESKETLHLMIGKARAYSNSSFHGMQRPRK